MAFEGRFAYDRDENGGPLMNCMTIIAGKAASATGRVMVGHNEDDGGHVMARHAYVPARDWPEGVNLPAEEECAVIEQVAHTLGYFWMECRVDRRGLSNSDSFFNERGVFIVSNSMGTSRESMENQACLTDGGLAYNLRRVLAERATSARDGVKILIEMVEKWGYAPSGRAYTIADKDEAFMIQIVHGRHYIGARVPDDHMVVMPNYYNFHTLHDCPEMFYSPDIVEYAEKMGWYQPAIPGDTSDFDFAKAYQAPQEYKGARNLMRQKHGQRLALGRDWNAEKEGFPFSILAARKIDLRLMADILCTHYEGTCDCWETFGPGASPHDVASTRTICTGTTLESMICDFQEEPALTVIYTAYGRPCEVPYVPTHPLMGVVDGLEEAGDAAKRLENHLKADPAALSSRFDFWHRLRRVESALEMVYSGERWTVNKTLSRLFVEAQEVNIVATRQASQLRKAGKADEAQKLLRNADREFLDRAVRTMEGLPLRKAEMAPPAPVSLTEMPEEITVAFEAPFEPTEKQMVFGLTHTDVRLRYAPVRMGSLRKVAEHRYEAVFPTEPFREYLHFAGKYDFVLGGLAADEQPFASLCTVEIRA